MTRPVCLVVLDGWGEAPAGPGNAITLAKTPHITRLFSTYPHTLLQASGEAVGLPRDEVGNTETGHLNIGAGHIVYQDLPRINMAIADGAFYTNKTFLTAVNHTRKFKSNLHIMGLIGAGGVHANNEHLFALLLFCHEQQVANVFLHLFTDGRDSPPTSGVEYLKRVELELTRNRLGKIVTLMGRYYAMDRDERWERTEKAYRALTSAHGIPFTNPTDLMTSFYQKGITDEFIPPSVLVENGKAVGRIMANDAVIFYNFRIDRPRQLTKAFVLDDFNSNGGEQKLFSALRKKMPFLKRSQTSFARGKKLENLFFVTMTEYERNLPVYVAFPQQRVTNPLGRVLADRGYRQLRLAESEKERFVTFYFNGQREMPFIGEDRQIIPSLPVPTYDLAPQMRAHEITDVLVAKLKENIYDLYIVNFANADMVGHTGVLSAAISACEVIDESIGRLDAAISAVGGALIITADHGNVEGMIDPVTGGVNTEHSSNPVPFIVVAPQYAGKPGILRQGVLADIAPTILYLLDIEQPIEMTGQNLLQ